LADIENNLEPNSESSTYEIPTRYTNIIAPVQDVERYKAKFGFKGDVHTFTVLKKLEEMQLVTDDQIQSLTFNERDK
jgi:hypothetical protein